MEEPGCRALVPKCRQSNVDRGNFRGVDEALAGGGYGGGSVDMPPQKHGGNVWVTRLWGLGQSGAHIEVQTKLTASAGAQNVGEPEPARLCCFDDGAGLP